MKYWLMKSEPGEFSIDDLARVKVEAWDGVRNYQARNFMRDEMSRGDPALFYHSSCAQPGIAGVMRIKSAAYADATAFDPDDAHYDPKSDPANPTWFLVDVEFTAKLAEPLTLQRLKSEPQLAGMRLLQRGNRLSVMPVEAKHWRHIQRMIKG